MTAVQAIVSHAVLSLPAVAPFAAASLGVAPSLVGVQVGLVYCVAIACSFFIPNAVRRYGAGRTSQIGLVLLAAGLLAAAIGTLSGVLAGIFLIGLSYGLPNPAASHLLNRAVPPHRRNILFSIKQAGVPIGGVMAGFVTVPIAGLYGWQAALVVVAGLVLALAAALQPLRGRWDADRDRDERLWRAPFAPLRLVLTVPALRSLTAAGVLLAANQLCLSTFLVVLLVHDYRLSPVAAGSIMAGVQAIGFAGRMAWGLLADRLRSGLAALKLLALSVALLSLILGTVPPGELGILLVPVLLGLGACAAAWSGIFLAEADRLAPLGRASEAATITLTGTYIGSITGTSLFAAVVPVLGSYSRAYLLSVVAAGAAALLLARARRRAA
jgi:MFS family permease